MAQVESDELDGSALQTQAVMFREVYSIWLERDEGLSERALSLY